MPFFKVFATAAAFFSINTGQQQKKIDKEGQRWGDESAMNLLEPVNYNTTTQQRRRRYYPVPATIVLPPAMVTTVC